MSYFASWLLDFEKPTNPWFTEPDRTNYDKSCRIDSDCILKGVGGSCSQTICINVAQVEEGKVVYNKGGLIPFVSALSCLPDQISACKCQENLCRGIDFEAPDSERDCYLIEDSERRKICYYNHGLTSNNTKACDNFEELSERIDCKFNLAIRLKQINFCKETGLKQDDCIFSVAEAKNDTLNYLVPNITFTSKNIDLTQISLIVIDDTLAPLNLPPGDSYDRSRFQRKTRIAHIVTKGDTMFYQGRNFWGSSDYYDFERADLVQANKSINNKLRALEESNQVTGSYLETYGHFDEITGKIIFTPKVKKAYFNLRNSASYIDRSDLPTNNIVENNDPHFCDEMYDDFSLFVDNIDLISFYKDECKLEVALSNNSTLMCTYIQDSIMEETCTVLIEGNTLEKDSHLYNYWQFR